MGGAVINLREEQGEQIMAWLEGMDSLGDVVDWVSDCEDFWCLPADGPIRQWVGRDVGAVIVERSSATGRLRWLYCYPDVLSAIAAGDSMAGAACDAEEVGFLPSRAVLAWAANARI